MNIIDRTKFFGASDAYRLIKGDWLNLYLEKTGEQEPEDLSGVFRVQLGIYTERFHADWVRREHRIDAGTALHHKELDFVRASPDGFIHLDKRRYPIDFKHSNQSATPRTMTDSYLPQVCIQASCMSQMTGYLSCIPGNDEPFLVRMDFSQEYQENLFNMIGQFWWHVTERVRPDIWPQDKVDQVKAIGKATTKVNAMRYVDMTGNNQWATLAGIYQATKEQHANHEQAKKDLKAMIEDDVAEVSGYGVRIKRSKSGSLLISEEKQS